MHDKWKLTHFQKRPCIMSKYNVDTMKNFVHVLEGEFRDSTTIFVFGYN